MDDAGRRGLLTELVAHREALLATVGRVGRGDLQRPTRNPGWTVQHVLAHLLATDAGLIGVLEAAGPAPAVVRCQGEEEHEAEMTRWMSAAPRAIRGQLREGGARWQGLLAALPEARLALRTDLEGGPALGEVLGWFRGHDVQHGEDLGLALEGGT